MDIERIKSKVATDNYVYTSHADLERKADDLTLRQVETALLNGQILEQYPDTGRGGAMQKTSQFISCADGAAIKLQSSRSTFRGHPNSLIRKRGHKRHVRKTM